MTKDKISLIWEGQEPFEEVTETIDLNVLKESANTPVVVTESLLTQLGAAVGGYIVGKKVMQKIIGRKSDVEELRRAIVGLRDTIDGIRRK